MSEKSNLLCNGVIDCRGYNGTYVYAEHGVDESPDYCYPHTTSTTTIFPSSMGWQPFTFSKFNNVATETLVLQNLTTPPMQRQTTEEYFWKSYCRRQVSINYCPRRCVIRGLCAPLRINPPRHEIHTLKNQMNAPVVKMLPRTRKPSDTDDEETTTVKATTQSARLRFLKNQLMNRIVNDEQQQGLTNELTMNDPFPMGEQPILDRKEQQKHNFDDFFNRNSNNGQSNSNKQRRDSAVDPSLVSIDSNTIYDWSDGSNVAKGSAVSTIPFSNLYSLLIFLVFYLL